MYKKYDVGNLRLVQLFILFIGVFFLIAAAYTIKITIQNPRVVIVETEIDLKPENQGYLQYEDGSPIDIKFSNIKGTITYKEKNPKNAPIAWAEILFRFIRIGLYLFIIFSAYKIMQNSLDNEPFTIANANKMKWLGYSFILIAVIKFIQGAVDLSIMEKYLTSNYINTEDCFSAYGIGKLLGEFMFSEIIIGFFALFVAALFKHGIALREENALTI